MIELVERIALVRGLHHLKALNKCDENTLVQLPPTGEKDWASLADVREPRETGRAEGGAGGARWPTPKHLFELSPASGGRCSGHVRSRHRADPGGGTGRRPDSPPCSGCGCRSRTTCRGVARCNWRARCWPWRRRKPPRSPTSTRTTASGCRRHPPRPTGMRMIDARRDKKPDEFNAAVADYRASHLRRRSARRVWPRRGVEVVYNRFAPFYQCTGLYVFAFLLAVVGFVLQRGREAGAGRDALRRSAFLVLVLTLVVHTVALFARMYLMDRPLRVRDQPVLVGRLHRLGVRGAVPDAGADLPDRRRERGRRRSSGWRRRIVAHNLATRGHAGDDAGGARHELLARDARHHRHARATRRRSSPGSSARCTSCRCSAPSIRDSFQKPGEPTVGELLGVRRRRAGLVGDPAGFLCGSSTRRWTSSSASTRSCCGRAFGVVAAVGGGLRAGADAAAGRRRTAWTRRASRWPGRCPVWRSRSRRWRSRRRAARSSARWSTAWCASPRC